jgi:hypothetical protein
MVIRRNLQKQRKSTDFAQNPKHLYWILWKYLPQTIPDMPYHELNKWKIHYINYWAASSYVRNRLSWLNLIHFWLFSRILFCSAEKFREWVALYRLRKSFCFLIYCLGAEKQVDFITKSFSFYHFRFYYGNRWKSLTCFNI